MKKTIISSVESQITIERSLFISYFFPLRKIEDFKNLFNIVKKDHPKATHIAYAYILDNIQRFSDDGEPSKTAGFPILELLNNNNLDEVVIFVVRYFGGRKLGTGGLQRAYSKCAQLAIEKAHLHNIALLNTYELIFDYEYSDIVEQFLIRNRVIFVNKNYDLKIKFKIATNNDLSNQLNDLTKGEIVIKQFDKEPFYLELKKEPI